MNVAFAVLLLFFFSPTLAIFDYFKIAETWPGSFCSMRPCLKEPNHFTLHGFWPSNFGEPQPSFCSKVQLDFQKIKLLDNICSYWPSLLGDEEVFWTKQWAKHGTCSGMHQEDYFKLALDTYANYNITDILRERAIVPNNTRTYDREDVIKAVLDHTGADPQLDCSKFGGKKLYEIRLCLDGRNRYINCKPTSIKCKQFIYYPRVHAIVENRGGGSTGTMREDAAKYFLNLDVNSTHYDPKARKMREDSLPDADPHEKFYGEAAVARSNYDEDVYINYHTTVWGTDAAGIEAAEAPTDLMKANIACKEVAADGGQCMQRSIHRQVVDEKSLAEPLGKKDQRKREEKDDKTIDLGSS